METKKLSLKYGAVAVVVALVIIAATIFANPLLSPIISKQLGPKTTFLVMLTDPPEVPEGTTQLNLTYAGISLHVNYPDGSSSWEEVQATGKVNLLSLVNVSQTIASITLPTGSIVDKIQFGISSVEATVNGIIYPVTTLTNQLLISIRGNDVVSGATSGVLLDLRPTLVQIRATNSTGGEVYYYVLVPSASAIVKTNIGENWREIGSRNDLEDDDNDELDEAEDRASRNVNITSASLHVEGNVTSLSVTFKNVGNTNETIFGLILHGDFNESLSASGNVQRNNYGENAESNDDNDYSGSESDLNNEMKHPESIPFKINGTSLVPLLGEDDHDEDRNLSSITLKPGQSITVSFSGAIQKHQHGDYDEGRETKTILTPITGSSYIIRLMGEGTATFNVAAS